MMAIKAIVSSGIEGAEFAALRTALQLGFRVGGCGIAVPLMIQAKYNVTPINSIHDEDADEMNVLCADGCVCFGGWPTKRKERIRSLCEENGKPFRPMTEFQQRNSLANFRLWVERNNIQTLLIVGPSERQNAGIGLAVEMFLREVLPLCR